MVLFKTEVETGCHLLGENMKVFFTLLVYISVLSI